MSIKANLCYSQVIDRIKTVTGCRTQTQLAAFLGISQSSTSDAVRRQAFPADWLLRLLLKKRVNPDWVLTGQCARYLREEREGRAPGRTVSLRLEMEIPARGCF